MHNYDNKYTQPGYETNYEFNPEYESGYEMENFANESDNEYGLNPEFNMEQSYEAGNNYENESGGWRNVIVPTRPGYRYRPATSAYQRRYYRQPYFRFGNSGYYRPGYRHSPYYRYRRPYNYYRNRIAPWYNRYAAPGYNNAVYNSPGLNYTDQGSQQFSQTNDMNVQPPSQGGGPSSQGSGVPNYILESIQNLSRQVAATNANVEAMQQSMAGAGKPDNMSAPPPPDNSMPSSTGAGAGQTSGSEHEMENYEFEMENGMMNEEGNNEMMEMEMAAELLATNNEMELDHFLGGIIGGSLKKLLKGVIKKALPIAGAAAGTFFGGPAGAQIGQQIGSAASGMFELELEGLSNEDQEFEVARAIIRLADDAARELEEGNSTGDPNEDAKIALIRSAMRHAPGLLVKKRRDYYNNNSGYGDNWHRR